jgi:hypothetical protein
MRNLSDPETRLERLFQALGRTSALIAPVAEQQASVFRNLNLTVEAFADVSRPYLQESIEEAPAALSVATREFPRQRPFLRDSERLFAELRPGARTLRTAAAPLADAIDAGVGTLARSVAFNRRLATSFATIEGLTQDPLASVGLGDLTSIVELAQPTISHTAPMQTVCNYLTLFLRNAGNLLSDGGRNGTWQRFVVIAPPIGKNSEQYPASAPAGGGPMDTGADLQANFLHANPLPNTASPPLTPTGTSVRECEAGNEPYVAGRRQIGNVPGNQGVRTEHTTRDEGVGR